MILEPAEIEKIAMDKLRDKWGHLYTFGYPKRPFPTNYENDLNNFKIGLYEGAKWQQDNMSTHVFADNISVRFKNDVVIIEKNDKSKISYSEEEVLDLFKKAHADSYYPLDFGDENLLQWFEKAKKK